MTALEYGESGQFQYFEVGRLDRSKIDRYEFHYDDRNHLTEVAREREDAEDGEYRFSYNACGQRICFEAVDQWGDVGLTHKNTFDSSNRLEEKLIYTPKNEGNPGVRRYEYERRGNLQIKILERKNSRDEAFESTTWVRHLDEDGKPTWERVYKTSSGEDARRFKWTHTYTYDSKDRLTTVRTYDERLDESDEDVAPRYIKRYHYQCRWNTDGS